MKSKKFKTRDWVAVDAHFRNSAGAMKDRRTERGGSTNLARDLIGEYNDDKALECGGMDISDDHTGNVGSRWDSFDCWEDEQ